MIPIYARKEYTTNTPATVERFNRLMGQNRNLCYWLMNIHNVSEYGDKNECYQEIMITVWLNFYKYHPLPEMNFGTWLRGYAVNAIRQYRSAFIRQYKRFGYEDDLRHYARINEDYTEELFDCLNDAIEDLPYSKQIRIKEIFTDQQLYNQFTDSKSRGGRLRREAYEIIMEIRNNQTAWQDNKPYKKLAALSDDGKYIEHGLKSIPIEQLDMEGKFIKSWASARAASEHGFSYKLIQSVAAGHRFSHGGYRWRYAGEVRSEITTRKKGKGGAVSKPIEQVTLTGEVVKVWPSASEAGKHGFERTLIRKVLYGKCKSHGGYFWRYAAEPTTIALTTVKATG